MVARQVAPQCGAGQGKGCAVEYARLASATRLGTRGSDRSRGRRRTTLAVDAHVAPTTVGWRVVIMRGAVVSWSSSTTSTEATVAGKAWYDVAPSAARLTGSLRDIGYDFSTAVADIVD